jgi:hypothetical protein
MNISELINKIVAAKQEKAQLAVQEKELNGLISQYEGDLMQLMAEAGTYRASSDVGHTVNMVQKDVPTVTDWPAFYHYVAETQQFEFLQKRLSTPAFKERWTAGETVPGVAATQIWDLSVTTKRG